jgi:hypothetical protein
MSASAGCRCVVRDWALELDVLEEDAKRTRRVCVSSTSSRS